MRLKRILLSLTAFVLALSSALPAGAEAFTIPTGSTSSCKKNEAPVNAWWPNGGNSSNYPGYTALVTTIENGITYNTSTRF